MKSIKLNGGLIMKPVNEKSKNVLDKLWHTTKEHRGYLKLNEDESVLVPLTVEVLGNDELSLCHYGACNGDPMRDPEMVFYKQDGKWFPIYYRNDWIGKEEFSCRVVDGKIAVIDQRRQHDQAMFADTWISNIEQQHKI
jgi:hypothetical protein